MRAGAKSPKGLLALNMTNASMIGIVGTVVGLGASEAAGWHIHDGWSCASDATTPSDATGGHFYDSSGAPPPPFPLPLVPHHVPPSRRSSPPTSPLLRRRRL